MTTFFALSLILISSERKSVKPNLVVKWKHFYTSIYSRVYLPAALFSVGPRSRHISHLVSPLNTVLDDSIGCALWFAALGVGRVRSFSVSSGFNKDSEEDTEEKNYTSKAKVKQLFSLSLENENCTHPVPSCNVSLSDVNRLSRISWRHVI